MKLIKFYITGILFGIVMTKSEAISWFRIQEMLRFDSFHMYGIIGTAVILGTIVVQSIKYFKLRNVTGEEIKFNDKAMSYSRYLIGGTIFGLGWSMTGACPGSQFTLLGHGYLSILVVILSGILGTYVYGLLRDRLPH